MRRIGHPVHVQLGGGIWITFDLGREDLAIRGRDAPGGSGH
jgi:hypothetical protein